MKVVHFWQSERSKSGLINKRLIEIHSNFLNVKVSKILFKERCSRKILFDIPCSKGTYGNSLQLLISLVTTWKSIFFNWNYRLVLQWLTSLAYHVGFDHKHWTFEYWAWKLEKMEQKRCTATELESHFESWQEKLVHFRFELQLLNHHITIVMYIRSSNLFLWLRKVSRTVVKLWKGLWLKSFNKFSCYKCKLRAWCWRRSIRRSLVFEKRSVSRNGSIERTDR